VVQLRGLSSNAGLNGQKATIAGPLADKGRIPVALIDGPSRIVSVKLSNLFVKFADPSKNKVIVGPPPPGGYVNPDKLPPFEHTAHGTFGRGTILEEFEGMVSSADMVKSHQDPNGFHSSDPFKEAQCSLLFIARDAQRGLTNVAVISDAENLESLVVYVRDVRELANGRPGLICGWVYSNQTSRKQTAQTVAMLARESQFGWPPCTPNRILARSTAEIQIIKKELEERQRQLDPTW
jgi:hypothetical protein